MRTLYSVILTNESYTEKDNLLNPRVENRRQALEVLDLIRRVVTSINTECSLTTKRGWKMIYKKFNELKGTLGCPSWYLTTFGIDTGLISFLYDNARTLTDPDGIYKWRVPNIKEFNLSKLEREHSAWVKSNDYVEAEPWNEADYDPEVRSIIIYDRINGRNPETTLKYRFSGKRGDKNNEHQINMFRVDWCNRCGFKTSEKYFDAYSKLEDNYIKYGPAEYQTVEDMNQIVEG